MCNSYLSFTGSKLLQGNNETRIQLTISKEFTEDIQGYDILRCKFALSALENGYSIVKQASETRKVAERGEEEWKKGEEEEGNGGEVRVGRRGERRGEERKGEERRGEGRGGGSIYLM